MIFIEPYFQSYEFLRFLDLSYKIFQKQSEMEF